MQFAIFFFFETFFSVSDGLFKHFLLILTISRYTCAGGVKFVGNGPAPSI